MGVINVSGHTRTRKSFCFAYSIFWCHGTTVSVRPKIAQLGPSWLCATAVCSVRHSPERKLGTTAHRGADAATGWPNPRGSFPNHVKQGQLQVSHHRGLRGLVPSRWGHTGDAGQTASSCRAAVLLCLLLPVHALVAGKCTPAMGGAQSGLVGQMSWDQTRGALQIPWKLPFNFSSFRIFSGFLLGF